MSSPRRVWWFLAVTFATTWSAWGLLALLTRAGTVELASAAGTTLLVVGGSAPMVGAYLATWRTPEAGSLRELTRRVLKFRAPISLWALAVLGAAVIGLVAMALTGFVTHVSWPNELANVVVLLAGLLVTSIVFGGIEEVGWRGVLQPAVSARRQLPVANLVIAGIWTVWHLPLFWVAGGSHADASFAVFLLAGIGYSAVMTWLYARTASVALCVIFHAGINAAAGAGVAFTVDVLPGFMVQAVVAVLVGTVLLVAGRHAAPG